MNRYDLLGAGRLQKQSGRGPIAAQGARPGA